MVDLLSLPHGKREILFSLIWADAQTNLTWKIVENLFGAF